MARKWEAPHKKRYSDVSYGFKIAVVILLFILTLLRLGFLLYFPSAEIVSDKVFLFIVLIIVLYLWIQELVDFYQLKQAQIDAIAALVKAEEARDLYTSGHSERVTKISLAIAQEMNLSGEVKKIIARAGILHDIGKIGISENILNKKEKLTGQEWEVIKNHPEDAVKILAPLKFLTYERKVVLSHHERHDGRGYPRGLKGEAIPLEARIMAVADAFDAMNSRRSYREPLSRGAIIEELLKNKGSQHSAEIVDILLVLLNKRPELWEK